MSLSVGDVCTVVIAGRRLQYTMLLCAECGVVMNLELWRDKPYYRCSDLNCRGTHGAHPDGRPLGVPANRETKEWRIAAHAAFDQLWGSQRFTRTGAYRWMQERFGLTKEQAHIGLFDVAMCRKLIEAIASEFKIHVPVPSGRQPAF